MKSLLSIITLFLSVATGFANISPLAVELDNSEKIALGAVRDNNSSIDETAFWMLCAKIAKNPTTLPPIEQTDSPAYGNLKDTPGSYRGQAINLNITAYTIEKITPGVTEGWPARQVLPADFTMWRINGLCNRNDKPQHLQPVMIYSIVEPAGLINRRTADLESDPHVKVFSSPVQFNVAGIFYKVINRKDHKTSEKRQYPVMLAYWQSPAATYEDSSKPWSTLMIGVIIMLVLGFIVLRKNVRRLKQTTRRPGETQTRIPQSKGETDLPVDADLIKAVEEFKKRK